MNGEDLREIDQGSVPGEGHDDMNAIELCLRAACGPRLQDGRERVSPWGKGERNHYVEIRPGKAHMEWSSVVSVGGESERRNFYTTVSSRTDRQPCRMVDDILLALINLSRRSGGFNEEIRTSRYEILSQMGVGANEPGGNQYKALNRGFEHLSAITVETNFIWMPEKEEFWEGSFGILGHIRDPSGTPGAPVRLRWSPTFRKDVLGRGWQKPLDLETYYGIRGKTARLLFRYLDKTMATSHQPQLSVDVMYLGQRILGLRPDARYPSVMKQSIRYALQNVAESGLFDYEIRDSQTESGKAVTFRRTSPYRSVLHPSPGRVHQALVRHGMEADRASALLGTEARRLFQCLKQLEHLAGQQARGTDEIEHPDRWLEAAITKDYDLPDPIDREFQDAIDTTIRWCDQVYLSLSDREKKRISERAYRRLSPETAEDLDEKDPRAIQRFREARRRILLHEGRQSDGG